MSLNLTPTMLAAAYDLLRSTPPYTRWKLPPSEGVKFFVTKRIDNYGTYRWNITAKCHEICVSTKTVGHLPSLLRIMAHEMIHVHEEMTGKTTKGEHSLFFRKCAAQVCKHHGFDPKMFY